MEFTSITKNEIEHGFVNAELRDHEDLVMTIPDDDPEMIAILVDLEACI